MRRVVGLAVVLAGAFCCLPASAATLAVDFTNFSSLGAGGNNTAGWNFRVVNDITVTQLGFLDPNFGGGLNESHQVGIWVCAGGSVCSGSTTSLVASGTVNPSDPVSGGYHFTGIAPVVLVQNGLYVIGAAVGSAATTDGMYGNSTFTDSANVQYIRQLFSIGFSGFSPPVNFAGGAGSGGAVGPNFMFVEGVVVPEPTAFLLLGTGLAIAGYRRRRKVRR